MNREEFVLALHQKLPSLPIEELEERLAFYLEMIEDRMEEGVSEAEAVAAVGSVEEIAAQILAEQPLIRIVNGKIKPKQRLRGWEVLLLVLGSPVWLSLAIAAFAVVLSLYISLWAVVISFWAVFVSVAVCGFAGIGAGVFFAVMGNGLTAAAMVGAGLICLGLSIFLFYLCRGASKGTVFLTKRLVRRSDGAKGAAQ